MFGQRNRRTNSIWPNYYCGEQSSDIWYMKKIITIEKQDYKNDYKMSSLTQQRRVVEQLRRESHIKRIMVSAAVEDLKVKNL